MELPLCSECESRPLSTWGDDYLCAWCRATKDGRVIGTSNGDIESVQVRHYDNNISPAAQLMDVGRVGNVIFIDLVRHEATFEERRNVTLATVGFNEEPLVRALIALGVPIEWKGYGKQNNEEGS